MLYVSQAQGAGAGSRHIQGKQALLLMDLHTWICGDALSLSKVRRATDSILCKATALTQPYESRGQVRHGKTGHCKQGARSLAAALLARTAAEAREGGGLLEARSIQVHKAAHTTAFKNGI